jgi:hypothetical protein
MYQRDPNKIKERDKRSLLQNGKTKIEKLAHNKLNSTELAKINFVLCFCCVYCICNTDSATTNIAAAATPCQWDL